MTEYPYHDYCKVFPPCSAEELEGLRASIEANGLIEPIVLLDGKILDGRNRATACLMLGIEPETVEYTGDDPLDFVLAKNLNRRHLNESQRAMVASKIATLPPYVHPKKDDMQICMSESETDKSANLHVIPTTPEAAKALNVSERQVRSAAKLRREAPPEVVEQVERGDKTVHAALKEMPQKNRAWDSEEEQGDEVVTLAHLETKKKEVLKLVRESFNVLGQIKELATHEYFWECLTAMDDLYMELFYNPITHDKNIRSTRT